MQNFWIDFAISIALTTLRNAIKNEESKETMRRAFFKVYQQILATYPEFAEPEK